MVFSDSFACGYSLGASELQYSIMAFASMGLITEALEYQPADQRSIPKKDRIEKLDAKTGMLGWTVARDEKKKPVGPNKWRQPFQFKSPVGSNIKDFPIYIAPGEALLMGKEASRPHHILTLSSPHLILISSSPHPHHILIVLT